jgi:hypothetical protein
MIVGNEFLQRFRYVRLEGFSGVADIVCGLLESLAAEDFAEVTRNIVSDRMVMRLRLWTRYFDGRGGRFMVMLHY